MERTTPTIRQLAQAAGVSIGTASKALNGGGRLRQETRDRVLAVATEIGYRPNDLAHSLRQLADGGGGALHGYFTAPVVKPAT